MQINGDELVMVRGDSESITVKCDNYTFVSGDKVEMTVRQGYQTPKVLHKTVTTFTSGKAVIDILPKDTQSLTPGVYRYDIQLTQSNGTVSTIVPDSTIRIRGDITYD